MGSRSGKRLTNAQKKANKKARKRPKYLHYSVPTGYYETYSAIKGHITEFLTARKQSGERWATLCSSDQIYRSVVVLLGKRTIFNVSRIRFEGDNVTIVISIHSDDVSSFDRIRMHSTWLCCHKEGKWALGDPNLFDELDVLLLWAYDQYASHEHPNRSND